jgi:hypothetical protein
MLDATPFLRAYARRRARALLAQNAPAAQEAVLGDLVRHAARTRFGKAHEFETIQSVEDFQARVPLRRYEDFWRAYWQQPFPTLQGASWPDAIPYVAESSGTTAGVSKYIPVSAAMIRANRRAAQDTLAFHALNHPSARLFGGLNFLLGGSTELRPLTRGVQAGDLSGIAAATMPWLARTRAFPPRDLALIADWDTKLDRMARAALGRDIRSIAGTPSWLLMLFQRLSALQPDRPRTLAGIFPNLELIVHGGTGFAPYRDLVEAWMQGTAAATREVYAASEGYIAAADAQPEDGLRLMLDNGLFFEFVRVANIGTADAPRAWLGNVALGEDYALVLSSNAGLFAYIIGDIVRFVSLSPPRIVVVGRLAHELSVFGEHVIGAELDAAIDAAARASGGHAVEYTAAALLPRAAESRGQHLFAVEFEGASKDVRAFARVLDETLMRLNADYQTHRHKDAQLLAPRVMFVVPGTFEGWMRARGRLGGQNKVPRVVAVEEMAAILEFGQANRKTGWDVPSPPDPPSFV